MERRKFLNNIIGPSLISVTPFSNKASYLFTLSNDEDPTNCDYAPPGEYIKDQTFVFTDGWWHLFSISGTRGYYHGYNGNEETFSWSVSKNLVDWEFRGHVMHPSLRKGTYDQHEVWAPFCMKAGNKFYMFYTGVVHPHRPMEYRRLGHQHPFDGRGHKETQGMAVSGDLTDWVKVDDPVNGLGIPGRDSNVVRDEENNRWLLYSTGRGQIVNGEPRDEVYISQSTDLLNWKFMGTCALFPKLDTNRNFGHTVDSWEGFKKGAGTTESMVIKKHPLNNNWIMMGNWQYALSDDPTNFMKSEVNYYDNTFRGKHVDLGFACEVVHHNNKWYRTSTVGDRDYWRLAFTEIEWVKDGAFRIVKPGRPNSLY